ncbi:MAG: MBOAT family protein [Clostridia bacterium]|nr:MBOAT family protein [Clostridia bacterium]
MQLNLKHTILLIASYVFYGWWDYRFCFLMLLLTAVAWFCARKIDQDKNRKLFVTIGVVFPLLILGFFKYFNFFVDSFISVFGIKFTSALNIILPVGISFYTFQSMSYTIDVFRGIIKSHSFMDVALYVSFFPQLVAGPIVKASDFMPQLRSNHTLKIADLAKGAQIFAFGLFKKIVIADNLSVFVDDVFSKPLAFSSLTVILAVISYSIQIYCDFSGYSDMAIGVAKSFGYEFNANFNMPYISKNVTEFWKRWHISLSTWLQEYLYIPLGGNRKGTVRRYINLLLTMILGGLWHGANYTFVFWGLLHGVALCIHKLFMKARKGKKATVVGSIISVLFTYAFVCICWVFFRAENFSIAMDVLSRMFIWQDGITQIFSWSVFGVAVIAIANIFALVRAKKTKSKEVNGYYPVLDLNKVGSLVIFFLEILLIVALAYTNANPFIYFQF